MSGLVLKQLILKHVLKNAAEHEGKASAGAIMNKVLGEKPELRNDMKKLGMEIAKTVKEVNALGVEKQKKELLAVWPDALTEKKEKPREWPDLPNATTGKVVLRVAPNVNAPMHIGHSRMLIINDEYKKRYQGKLVFRFDDTDPDVKRPMLEAYEWHLEDCAWLGVEPDVVLYASDRVPLYYEHAEKLIRLGGAYTCSCAQEKAQEARRKGMACACRSKTAKESLADWKNMLSGGVKKGEMVLKIRADLENPNPALRDWVAFRVANEAHPRVGRKYAVWPMLDFQSLVDDHETGVTHILRGKELTNSTSRQARVYEAFGWKYPETRYWGRVAIHEFGKISKTDIKKAIDSGKYSGWDDPRLPTLRGLRKRGIRPEAIREFWVQLGFSERDISASMKILEAINKKYAGK